MLILLLFFNFVHRRLASYLASLLVDSSTLSLPLPVRTSLPWLPVTFSMAEIASIAAWLPNAVPLAKVTAAAAGTCTFGQANVATAGAACASPMICET